MTDTTIRQCEVLISKIQEDIDRNIKDAMMALRLRNLCTVLLTVWFGLIALTIIWHHYFFTAMDVVIAGSGVWIWCSLNREIKSSRFYKRAFARQRDEVRQWLDDYKARKERGFE